MRIVGNRAEVEITKDEYGHKLHITKPKQPTAFLRFGDADSEQLAIDMARIFAGASDLSPETVDFLWEKIG